MADRAAVMYSLKPLINFSEDIDLPTNMYKMKTLSSFDDTKSDKQHEIKDTNQELDEIETKQTLILLKLEELQAQMELLRKQLTRSQTANPSKQDTSKSNVISTKIVNFKQDGLISDVVINADPEYPPYSLLGVESVWNGFFYLNITSYVHSSIISVPAELLSLFSRQRTQEDSSLPTLNITLVWKAIGPDCEFIISPLTHSIIRGEVNVLRFFHRHINDPTDPIEETVLDGFLDSCYSLSHLSTKKGQTKFLRKLNTEIGKSEWFGGNEISIRDLAAWSTIRRVNSSDLTQKLSKWLENCNHHILGTA